MPRVGIVTTYAMEIQHHLYLFLTFSLHFESLCGSPILFDTQFRNKQWGLGAWSSTAGMLSLRKEACCIYQDHRGGLVRKMHHLTAKSTEASKHSILLDFLEGFSKSEHQTTLFLLILGVHIESWFYGNKIMMKGQSATSINLRKKAVMLKHDTLRAQLQYSTGKLP